MIYLASPYSHPTTTVREHRYQGVCLIAKELAVAGYPVMSPIAQWHAIEIMYELPTDAKFWWDLNRNYLDACKELWIAKMPGWQQSKGVIQEHSYAEEKDYPVSLVNDITYTITPIKKGDLIL